MKRISLFRILACVAAILAGAPRTSHAVDFAENQSGFGVGPLEIWKFVGDPATLQAYTFSNQVWALQLIQGLPGQDTRVLFSPPPPGAGNLNLATLHASFDFSMVGGNDRHGFSFNYAQSNTFSLIFPPLSDEGIGDGLSIRFYGDTNAATPTLIDIKYLQETRATLRFPAGTNAPGWTATYPGYHYRARIELAEGARLTFNVDKVTRVNNTNVYSAIPGFPQFSTNLPAFYFPEIINPAGSGRFAFGARTEGAGGMRVLLDNITLRGDSRPQFFRAPTNSTINEDTLFTTNFVVRDFETGTNFQVTATSDNQTLIPNSALLITGTGTNRTLSFTPATNASGTATITLAARAGSRYPTEPLLTNSRFFTVTVRPVNDPPIISVVPNQTMDEDGRLDVNFTISDVDSTQWNNPTAISTNQNLVANGFPGISLTGSGSARTLSIVPLPNANGQTTIEIAVRDGFGDSSTNRFTLTVNPINDPPVAGSRTALEKNGTQSERVAGTMGLPPGNPPFTLEAWVRPVDRAITAKSWILDAGSNAPITGSLFWYANIGSGTANFYAGSLDRGQVGPIPLRVGAWTHIATVWDGTNFTVYFDGLPARGVTAIPNGFSFSNGALNLGIDFPPSGTVTFRGGMDEVRVWNRPLDLADIRRAMLRPLQGTESGLVTYWRFDEGTNKVAYDSSRVPGPAGEFQSRGNRARLTTITTYLPLDSTNTFGLELPVDEDRATPVFLPGFDVEVYQREVGATLRFDITRAPTNGTLNFTTGAWENTTRNPVLYTPRTNYVGPDSFSYRLTDSGSPALVSDEVTIRLNVADVNDPPSISAIDNRVAEQNTVVGPLAFTIGDSDSPLTALRVGVNLPRTQDRAVVPLENVLLAGSGSNWTVTVIPGTNQIGTVLIEISVSDGIDLSTESFEIRFDPMPAYAVVDLGALGALNQSLGLGLNDEGWAVGLARSQPGDSRATLYKGLGGDGTLHDLGTLGPTGTRSEALGINRGNRIVGFATSVPGALREAFIWENDVMRSLRLALLSRGEDSVAYGVNDSGDIVGSYRTANGSRRPFLLTGSATNDLNTSTATNGEAVAINILGVAVGFRAQAGGDRATRWSTTNGVELGTLPGDQASRALGINDDGRIVGYSETAQRLKHAFLYANNTMTQIAPFPGATNAVARAINNFGEIVGDCVDQQGRQRVFLHTAGKSHDLNDLIHDSRVQVATNSGWTLEEARAINRYGTVVGTGTYQGRSRQFMAVPAWVIGRKLAVPEGAVARYPEIDILSGNPTDTPQNSFFWSEFEQRLYPIRPVTARIRWHTTFANTTGTGTNVMVIAERVERVGIAVWPKEPTIHVADAPVEIEPKGVGFEYTYQAIQYDTTDGSSRVDLTSKIFNSSDPGYTVLYYLRNTGSAPSPATQSPYFDVVRTVRWNDPSHLIQRQAYVGDKLVDPPDPAKGDTGHTNHLGKNGFVFFELAYYDGYGPDRAYERENLRGSIIPVNKDTPVEADDLVVVWFRMNPIQVAWASRPVRYRVDWPPDNQVRKIIIASGQGSGPLPALDYPSKRVYHQDDPSLPGYNPNEEHALLLPSAGGQDEAMFALRNDLNRAVAPTASEPYALLKFQDPTSGLWCIQPYKVVAEEDPYFFQYTGVAGVEVQPPYPLSALPLCDASHGVGGPYWEDYNGKLYARAAGPQAGHTNILVRWFYPLQPSFFYDLNRDGQSDAEVGSCLAWLDRRPAGELSDPNSAAGQSGNPIVVTYDIAWPKVATLQIGETLIDSKRGLPSVRDMLSVEVIYDDLTPQWDPANASAPINGLARLYDPLSTRVLKLGVGDTLPSDIRRVSRNGKEIFQDLPFTLRSRLVYDPLNRWLLFSGYLNQEEAGEPLLLPNVLFSRERDVLKELAPSQTSWHGLVNQLYDLTRNPNQVDLEPLDGHPDDSQDVPSPLNLNPGLRLGLITQYEYTHVVTQDAGNGSQSSHELLVRAFQLPSADEIRNLRNYRVVSTNVVIEPLGDLPKALTAGLGGLPAAPPNPGRALRLDGIDDSVRLGPINLNDQSFTIEFWAKRSGTATNRAQILVAQGTSGASGALSIGFETDQRFAFGFGVNDRTWSAEPLRDTDWHHWACTYDAQTRTRALYLDGRFLASTPNVPSALQATGDLWVGRRVTTDYFEGDLDDLRVWNHARDPLALAVDASSRLTGNEDGLVRYFLFDESGSELLDSSPAGIAGERVGGVGRVASTAPTGIPPRYITLVENNDPELNGLPVALHIIRVDGGPFAGDMKIIPPDNVFDEKLTMRHSSDFGGDPDPLTFEWYYKPDLADFDATDLPATNPDGTLRDSRGWIFYSRMRPGSGQGVNDITLGNGGESGLLTISDNWWICRYRGFKVGRAGADVWSDWIGDPSGTDRTRAKFAPGWIKRVIGGLNPFDTRTTNFHEGPLNTYVSMVQQAGQRYEGPIAFNPSADNLNSIGLIEAYQTVLDRGRGLSINGTPPASYEPANNALLLVAGRIADFYALLGNEAYADAQDPTVGFGTSSGEYGALAASIFSFQNQLDSLLEEELALLRGRDDRNAGVGAPPVYNRLYWNFTTGEGEIAYQQNYNITDQNRDGFINEFDARILYPQGHGDAWGHYLTALTTYYALLRHQNYAWVPRSENINVSGVAIKVDFLDERKFASIAAAKARTGRETVDLTYRLHYVEDPEGQWQGYKDTDVDRAWGVSEWATRAGQGAFFDWLTANALLPDVDPNPNHTGIDKIDRTTVVELKEIIGHYDAIQGRMEESDAGLNPLGLAKGVVPFDIDPTFLEVGSTAQIGRRAVQGLTQFDQILERAIQALKNAVTAWDQANLATERLRGNQDSIDDFTRNVREQETDSNVRLIEIFGYPYAGTIGAGKAFKSGYNGYDSLYYMYVDTGLITGQSAPPAPGFTAFYNPSVKGLDKYTFHNGADPTNLLSAVLPVDYPLVAADYPFTAPPEWGKRRAPGEIQLALSDLIQADAQFQKSLQDYDGMVQDITAAVELLAAQYNLNGNQLKIRRNQLVTVMTANSLITLMNGVSTQLRIGSTFVRGIFDGIAELPPKVLGLDNDTTSGLRGTSKLIGAGGAFALDVVAGVLETFQTAAELSKEVTGLSTDLSLEVESQKFEVLQSVKAIEQMMRNEAALRLEAYTQREILSQSGARVRQLIAEGERALSVRDTFSRVSASEVTEHRYRDMTFRIMRNDALQKYRAQFDLAARYVYLAATAYDYELNFFGSDPRAARNFLTEIVRQRHLGQVIDGQPVAGRPGLADILARMEANWTALKPRLGVNNPQITDTRFSLREELFRVRADGGSANQTNVLGRTSAASWAEALRASYIPNLWDLPEFRRYCRPFAPESAGPQPGLVIRFPTTITFGLNYFGWPVAAGDSFYDSSQFSTKIARTGVWFESTDPLAIAQTPRVYLVPIGMDVMRAPGGDDFGTREWRIIDQSIPAPFPMGVGDFNKANWIPQFDSLAGTFGEIRRYSSLLAQHDDGTYAEEDLTNDTRLVGRSAWNREWMLIIPGGTLLFDPDEGIDALIATVQDIKIYFQTYSYSGN